jgi:hypothetical protein
MHGTLVKPLALGLAILALGPATNAVAKRKPSPPPPSPSSSRPTGPLVPASGVLFGGYSNQDTSNWWTQSEVLTRESLLGRRYAIDAHVAWYAAYGKGPGSGMLSELQWDAGYGRIPLVSFDGPTRPFPGYAAIANGSQDSYILQWAQMLKSVGRPLFFRPWWEMNGNWFSWGNRDPATYVAAWRHMHDLFSQAGATNVVWVWCPNVTDGGAPHWTNYYPGDAYVDWVGIDGYNWGGSAWKSFATRFAGASQNVYMDYAQRKPIMIAEYGSVEQGGDKGQWYRDMVTTVRGQFPSIAALVAWDSIDSPTNFTINTTSNALAGYMALASDTYFNPPQ